jgi:1-acyl-sn-glycerol-3-phosphate acyltransferase
LAFFIIYFTYLVLVMEPLHWLLVRPLVALFPSRRRAIVRVWLRLQAKWVLGLAHHLAGMRLSIRGAIAPTSSIVLMNHQSLLDIPLGVSLVAGPYPLIPARASYRYGIPGISSILRLTGSPLLRQDSASRRSDLSALLAAADQVAGGRHSLLIYPEGHRSRDGEILPFMSAGLRQILPRTTHRPVYVVVADGLWPVRTFSDVAFRLAGTSVRALVLGPYTIPQEREKLGEFIEGLRRQMITGLQTLRGPETTAQALGAPQPELAR